MKKLLLPAVVSCLLVLPGLFADMPASAPHFPLYPTRESLTVDSAGSNDRLQVDLRYLVGAKSSVVQSFLTGAALRDGWHLQRDGCGQEFYGREDGSGYRAQVRFSETPLVGLTPKLRFCSAFGEPSTALLSRYLIFGLAHIA